MKRSKSEKALMKAGKKLFWKHGMRRVSVEEVCMEAGVSKMTFYRKFEHKYDLVLQLLSEMVESSIAEYDNIMASKLSYPEKITKVMDFKQKEAKSTSMELVKDIFSGGEEYQALRDFMQESQVEFMQKLRSDFERAQEEGYIRSELSVDVIIHVLQNMRQLTGDSTLLAMYDELSDLSRDLSSMFFYGIMNK